MEEEINREEVYSFSYTNREDGRQISTSFHPIGDTWEHILPEFRSFLQGVGFEFYPGNDLRFVDTSAVEAKTTEECKHVEMEKSGHWIEGYSAGFQEAVNQIQRNVIKLLTLQDAQILNKYLKSIHKA